jgi:site-specific DNA-methyltransferase (adenine-specific)
MFGNPSPSTINAVRHQPPADAILHGDCIDLMRNMASESIDFVLTDPPYLANYHSRDGRGLRNDTKDDWLKPAFRESGRDGPLLERDRRQ